MDADVDVVLAGCVGNEGELRLAVAVSGLGAAEVGVGVDAALEMGFVGDIDEPAEPERADANGDADAPAAAPGAGPIFRGARPTGGALVDMTAAISSCYYLSFYKSFLCVPFFLFFLPLFFLVGDAGLSDRSSDGEWNAHVTVGPVYRCSAPNPVGYRFIGRLWCQGGQQRRRIWQGHNNELTIDDAIDVECFPVRLCRGHRESVQFCCIDRSRRHKTENVRQIATRMSNLGRTNVARRRF